jgi:hypothetical protein
MLYNSNLKIVKHLVYVQPLITPKGLIVYWHMKVKQNEKNTKS